MEISWKPSILDQRSTRAFKISAFDAKQQETRDYLLNLNSGKLRPVTPAGSRGGKLSPDGSKVVTLEVASGKPLMVDIGSGKTSEVPGLASHDEVLGWTADNQSLLVWDRELPARIFSVDVARGRSRFIESVEPNVSVGSMYVRLVTSADGKVAAYRLRRGLYAVYVADGLR